MAFGYVFLLFWMFLVVSEVRGGQNRVRHVQIHPWDTLEYTPLGVELHYCKVLE